MFLPPMATAALLMFNEAYANMLTAANIDGGYASIIHFFTKTPGGWYLLAGLGFSALFGKIVQWVLYDLFLPKTP